MAINSRTKGANFEREIGNLLVQELNLTQPVKRILEQTRTKELPDLKLGRWCIAVSYTHLTLPTIRSV